MTCLEHLIENCLHNFETTNKTPDEILAGIEGDINLHYSGITAEQCYEICQYVFYSWYKERESN